MYFDFKNFQNLITSYFYNSFEKIAHIFKEDVNIYFNLHFCFMFDYNQIPSKYYKLDMLINWFSSSLFNFQIDFVRFIYFNFLHLYLNFFNFDLIFYVHLNDLYFIDIFRISALYPFPAIYYPYFIYFCLLNLFHFHIQIVMFTNMIMVS